MIINEVEYYFLLAVCVSSFVKCRFQSFAHFSIGLFIFFLLICWFVKFLCPFFISYMLQTLRGLGRLCKASENEDCQGLIGEVEVLQACRKFHTKNSLCKDYICLQASSENDWKKGKKGGKNCFSSSGKLDLFLDLTLLSLKTSFHVD